MVTDEWLARRDRLFFASCIALIVTAMSFAIRGNLIQPLSAEFGLTKEQIGWVVGTAFWGFTLAMIIGGPLCDILGMGRLLGLAFIGHTIGIVLTITASGFWTLFFSTLAFGMGNGFVEAACNPLIATLYPDQKIKRLNLFHVWFPGGIVIGGLTAFAITSMGLSWKLQMASMLLPLVVYAILFFGQKFPQTERAASGVSTGQMFAACLQPFFLLFVLCMLMTAVTELGPGQWIPNILTFTTGVAGILYLVWINGLMAVGRTFAGQLVHHISPVGVLLGSATFSIIGLYLLSTANAAGIAFVAATLFAIGVCFFWPTMLGVVAERFPKTGALGLAIMGGAGMLASNFIQPQIGATYDAVTNKQALAYVSTATDPKVTEAFAKAKSEVPNEEVAAGKALGGVAGAKDASDDLKKTWVKAQADGGSAALKQVVVLPIVLVVIFGAIFLYDKSRGGYKKEILVRE